MAIRLPHLRLTRDLSMFIIGGVAFVNEVIKGTDRPNIIYGSLALMGVAAYLRGMASVEKQPK